MKSDDEPIAIIGMGCRFPGGASGPEAFWRMLKDGVDGIGKIPLERWNAEKIYSADASVPGTACTLQGGFIPDVDKFDPDFFGISPAEALALDPQQRLLLEITWEALEHAGEAGEALRGSRTGVFVGASSLDYLELMKQSRERTELEAYLITGNSLSAVAGRIAYFFGFQGPTLSVDTACSSSLVAIHLACQSLRAGQSARAVVGGVNLMLTPGTHIVASRMRAISPDGRCKSFDERADGFGRGEGCGVLILKRLSDAQANGDRVLALIRGSAVNQDGASTSFTAPSGPAQERLIRDALRDASIDPAQVAYCEAHGTGTLLGDPIEVEALGNVMREGRDPAQPLWVGSVKSNIGHLEAAAGVSGVMKLVLALQHQAIPPNLHFRKANPNLALEEIPAVIPTSLVPFPALKGRRIGTVSGFGITGTNAHLVLEEAPPAAPIASGAVDAERPLHLVCLSARTEGALREQAAQYLKQLSENPGQITDLGHTANVGRTHFGSRLCVLGHDSAELRTGLLAFGEGRLVPGLLQGRVSDTTAVKKVAFVLPGATPGIAQLGRELHATQPTFRKNYDRCAALLGVALTEAAEGSAFALEYALAQLWIAWGVMPAALIGRGSGELVAATLAGILTLEDALKLERARAGGAEEFERVSMGIRCQNPKLRLISEVTGKTMRNDEASRPGRWRGAGGDPVVSVEARIQALATEGFQLFLNLGEGKPGLSSLVAGRSDWEQILETLGALHCQGVKISWRGFDQDYPGRKKIFLPTYPFQRKRYWVQPLESASAFASVEMDVAAPIATAGATASATALAPVLGITPGAPNSLEELERILRQIISQGLRLDPEKTFTSSTGFEELGMDSLMAVNLRGRIQKLLQLREPLPRTALFEHASTGALAGFLLPLVRAQAPEGRPSEAGASMPKNPRTVRISRGKDDSARTRLICFHYAGGSAAVFKEWGNGPHAAHQAGGVEIHAVQLPGRWSRIREPLLSDIHELARDALSGIRPLLEGRPFAMMGYSMGAILAHEVLELLRQEKGPRAAVLFVASAHAPSHFPLDLGIHRMDDAALIERMTGLFGFSFPPNILADQEARETLLPILRADYQALETYRPRAGLPFDFPIHALGGEGDAVVGVSKLQDWHRQTTGPFSLQQFKGGHFVLETAAAEVLDSILAKLRELPGLARAS